MFLVGLNIVGLGRFARLRLYSLLAPQEVNGADFLNELNNEQYN